MGRKLLRFCPVDWLDVSHGAYITARPAGWEHCLCLSVGLTRTHTFLLAADKVPECLPACVPHPGAVSLSDSSTLCFFPPSLSQSSISSLHTSVVCSDSSVTTPANFSLQLVRDWAHLFTWFAELRVACTYYVSLHVLLLRTRPLIPSNTITTQKTHFCDIFFLWLTGQINFLVKQDCMLQIFRNMNWTNKQGLTLFSFHANHKEILLISGILIP